jgi:hypothetical protein
VTFEVAEVPERLRYCHCESCKKLSGAGATLNAGVPTSAIEIVEGRELLETYEPPGGSAKTFCRRCGSNLFGGGWPTSERTSVRVSAFDDSISARPNGHIFVRSVAEWETLPDDGLDRFETVP